MAKSTDTSTSRKKAKSADTAQTYETKVKEIEAIIDRIESGELELESVFTEFGTAVEYLQDCDRFLQERQQQLDLMIETLTDD
ncbi:MAG: exodeoxyribonuclease VII small subunit [Cyanobacteria bacterium P01_A01_bin.45]